LCIKTPPKGFSFYNDSTGNENNSTVHTSKDLKTKTRWDHDVVKVTTARFGAITLESYTLASDGTMIVNVVRPEGRPITLVFQHKYVGHCRTFASIVRRRKQFVPV
jgi:hypothetical protein